MVLKIHLALAFLLTVIAVLYQIECNCERWKALEVAKLPSSPENLMRFIANTDTVNKWFLWVSSFKAADSRPIGKGKKYRAYFSVPLYGQYAMLFHLVECRHNQMYVLESESLLKPRFTIKLEQLSDSSTSLSLGLEFRRTSALYHVTLGPVLWFLSHNQLLNSLLILKMMFPF